MTIDANIGQYYHNYIAPYKGRFGPGAAENRFFPSPGNHDWLTPGLEPYLEYFTLPHNERYYDFVWGPVHFFSIDSDRREPHGRGPGSKQALWFREKIARSTAPWKVAYMHHAPYSSGDHGSTPAMQWPFADWNVDLVIAGHDHHYERIEREGVVYIVNGLGGSPKLYEIHKPIEGSIARFGGDHGAMFVEADLTQMRVSFVTHGGKTVDSFELTR